MFFFLSKILQFLISPFVWMTVIFLLSFCTKNEKWKKDLRVLSLIIFLFFSNPFIANQCVGLWEEKQKSESELAPHYNYGIILTGMIYYDTDMQRINFGKSADRLFSALQLYYNGRFDKFFITGGSGFILDQETKESVILKDYLLSINVPESDIIIETESRNTHENASESAKILNPNESNESYLLITSAFHMRRAAKCFENEGFVFDTYSTDTYYHKTTWNLETTIIPSAGAFTTWSMLLHEIIGYIMYDWTGYF